MYMHKTQPTVLPSWLSDPPTSTALWIVINGHQYLTLVLLVYSGL